MRNPMAPRPASAPATPPPAPQAPPSQAARRGDGLTKAERAKAVEARLDAQRRVSTSGIPQVRAENGMRLTKAQRAAAAEITRARPAQPPPRETSRKALRVAAQAAQVRQPVVREPVPTPVAPVVRQPAAAPVPRGVSVTADFQIPRKAPKGDHRTRILFVVGKTDWVFANIARQVATSLAPNHDYAVGVQAFSGISADHVHLAVALGWGAMAHIGPNVRADRILLGVYDNLSWRSPRRQGIWRAALRKSHGVIAANPRIAADLRAAGVTLPIYTLPDGVETGRFQSGPLPTEFTVGWAGDSNCSPGRDLKGVEIIREAAKRAGVKLDMADAVFGKRPFAEMPAFYRGLSVYLCASESEGTPNPILEAMASGRPVITTNVGIVPELVTSANGIVVERSPEAFAEAITRLRALPHAELQAMGVAARTAAEAHDWSKRLPAWQTAIRTVLKE